MNTLDSPTYQAIEKAFAKPTPTLKYLKAGDVYNLNDLLELPSGPIVVGYSVLYRPGQMVAGYDMRFFKPRRYTS